MTDAVVMDVVYPSRVLQGTDALAATDGKCTGLFWFRCGNAQLGKMPPAGGSDEILKNAGSLILVNLRSSLRQLLFKITQEIAIA